MSACHITSYCYFQDFIRSYKIRFYFGPSIESMAELFKFQGHQDINYINYVEIPVTPIYISFSLKTFVVSMILSKFLRLIFEQ